MKNTLKQVIIDQNKERKRPEDNIAPMKRCRSEMNLKAMSNVGSVSKDLYTPHLRRIQSQSTLEDYLTLASEESVRPRGKRCLYSRQSSTPLEAKYSRTVVKQEPLLE